MKELDVVKLKMAFNGLSPGTEGVIVHVYNGPHYEVEFFDNNGDTIDVLTTPSDILELVETYKD